MMIMMMVILLIRVIYSTKSNRLAREYLVPLIGQGMCVTSGSITINSVAFTIHQLAHYLGTFNFIRGHPEHGIWEAHPLNLFIHESGGANGWMG